MNPLISSRYRISNIGLKLAVCVAVLILAAYFGSRPSPRWLGLLVAGMGAVVLLQRPPLGLSALVAAALAFPIEFGTGTAIVVNPATLLVPVLLAFLLLDRVHHRNLRLVPSRTTRPLALFLLAGLLSLMVGIVFWDPAVPRAGNFTLVQVAQWAIFAFSAGAFWLMGNLVRDEAWLRRLTLFFLAVAGSLVMLLVPSQIDFLSPVLPETGVLANQLATEALHRAPFWMLLTALLGGQLLFNRKLSNSWRLFLLATLGGVLVYAFDLMRETASNWVGVTAVGGVLAWLRFPRLRWLVVVLLLVLASTGFLSSTIYDFAGGEEEWQESGVSRLALISRVLEVTLRSPVTGLGPAAYRAYARTKPLSSGRALWLEPNISSHNNYVDLFSHVGLLGLALFFWFVAELIRLGLRLRVHFTEGFSAGYVNAMLAAGVGALMLMLLADWILPFIYNISFRGFQASVLVWMFLGGLVTLEQVAVEEGKGR